MQKSSWCHSIMWRTCFRFMCLTSRTVWLSPPPYIFLEFTKLPSLIHLASFSLSAATARFHLWYRTVIYIYFSLFENIFNDIVYLILFSYAAVYTIVILIFTNLLWCWKAFNILESVEAFNQQIRIGGCIRGIRWRFMWNFFSFSRWIYQKFIQNVTI